MACRFHNEEDVCPSKCSVVGRRGGIRHQTQKNIAEIQTFGGLAFGKLRSFFVVAILSKIEFEVDNLFQLPMLRMAFVFDLIINLDYTFFYHL